MLPTPDWLKHGNPACLGEDTKLWFVNELEEYREDNDVYTIREAYPVAKAICFSCEILDVCRDWGIKHEEYGIWGGMSPSERKRYRSKHKIVLKSSVTVDEALR